MRLHRVLRVSVHMRVRVCVSMYNAIYVYGWMGGWVDGWMDGRMDTYKRETLLTTNSNSKYG